MKYYRLNKEVYAFEQNGSTYRLTTGSVQLIRWAELR